MAKRIVVCSDGTGNTDIKGRGTNVFKLYEAVDLTGHRSDPSRIPQVALYDDGVGTERFKPLKIFAGATGWGLSRNVKQLYKELARIYDPGDEIYVFGFSRGAFTIRTLVGMIGTCGLIDRSKVKGRSSAAFARSVDEAYDVYRKCFRTRPEALLLGDATDDQDVGAVFRNAYAHRHEVRIRFVGVWDTVDAVGLPFYVSDVINAFVYRYKFPDRRLSPIVDFACQALAIDDERHAFSPVLWEEEPGDEERIQQVWFAGAHSNVGGGYPKQGMSLVALDWMMSHAEQAGLRSRRMGLRFNSDERRHYRQHANVDDKLYNPRAGLGTFYRWKPRNIAALCRRSHVKPKIHVTALERIAHGTEDYAPGNLPANAAVVATHPVNALIEQRVSAAAQVLRTYRPKASAATIAVWVRLGRVSYYLYPAVCAAVVWAAAAERFAWRADWMDSLATMLRSTPAWWLSAVFTALPYVLLLALGWAAAFTMSVVADRKLRATYSESWYECQQDLREALKDARTGAAPQPTRWRELEAVSDDAGPLVGIATATQ